MMADVEFVDGFYVNEPNKQAPSFVKCTMSINKDQFLEWLKNKKANEKGYINLDVKEARSSGKWYASVNNFEPKHQSPDTNKSAQQQMADDGIDDDDIPF